MGIVELDQSILRTNRIFPETLTVSSVMHKTNTDISLVSCYTQLSSHCKVVPGNEHYTADGLVS